MSSYSNTTLSQIVKIPKSVALIEDLEIEWLIGPIEIYDEEGGKEFIHKVTLMNGNNHGEFYTDANGRQNVKRIRNFRIDYDIRSIPEV